MATKSDGKLPFLTEALPDNIIAVMDGGVAGYFQVDSNPGIELNAPYDQVTAGVFRSLGREAKRNNLKLEYNRHSRSDVQKRLQRISAGDM